MRVVLSVVGGPCEGRKTWLRPAQSVSVGRSASRAYFALVEDSRLDDVHFTVRCHADRCMIESPASDTRLNGQPVTTARLRDGDVLTAGSSRIAVTLEGAAYNEEPEQPTESAVAISPERSPPARPRISMEALRLESGGFCYRLRADATHAAVVVRRLAESATTHLVAAPDEPIEFTAARETLLFNWLPENCAHVSPRVALEFSPDHADEVLSAAAGKNALTFVFSTLTGDDLTEHLRSAARGKLNHVDQPREHNLLLTFEPSLLEERLPACDAHFTSSFFSQVEALFFESKTKGEWLVVSGKQQTDLLQRVNESVAPTPRDSTAA